MEAAQAAIARHTSRRGHFTHVEEIVRPAITSETIKPHRHEITTEALDREVHQHHYHTTVQPLSHTETLPARHSHNLVPVKKTTHEHDDVEENKRRLAEFAALFRDISTTLPTTHSSEKHAAVVGEHVHHHVHETVQPIIYKETVHRETVHTTIPIHEVHHNKARHHGLSSMPVKTMEEFLSFHAGRKDGEVRHSRHEGAPREYDSKLATTFEKLGLVAPAAAATTTTPAAAPVATPTSATSRTLPSAINTTTSPTTTTTTTSSFRSPTTPTRKPVRRHHDATNQGLTSPNTRGSFSSDSSVSSSAPSTPNSPTYRNNMLPKNNVMNTMPLNKEVMGPTTTTNTVTPNTNVNTQTNTSTMVNTTPNKTTNAAEPVRIVRNSGEGDMSPRYSSDEANTGRRSFMNRLTGSRRSQHA